MKRAISVSMKYVDQNVQEVLLENVLFSFCRIIMGQLKLFSVIIHLALLVVWFAQLVTCALVDATFMLLRKGLSILVAYSNLLRRYVVRAC